MRSPTVTLWVTCALGIGCAGAEPEATTPPRDGGVVVEVDAGTRDGGVVPRCADPAEPIGVASAPALDPAPTADAIACAARSIERQLADADVICLGEDSHGVAESIYAHGLLLRHLIEDLGARTIVFEATEATTEAWDLYLDTRDERDLARGFRDMAGSLGASVEREALLRFLATIDVDADLHITGFDVAVQSAATIQSILDHLDQVEPETTDRWRRAFLTSPDRIADSADELATEIADRRAAHVAATSEDAVRRLERDLVNLADGQRFLARFYDGDFEGGNATYREPGMTRNMLDLLQRRGDAGPIVMLAHNGHCHRTIDIGIDLSGEPTPSVGASLATALGDDYRTIFQFYEGGRELAPTANGFVARDYFHSAAALAGVIFAASDANAFFLPSDTDLVDFSGRFTYRGEPIIPTEAFDGVHAIRSVTAVTLR
ncbi:MAG: erythromycin esterase family protein [Deltaproteobacteria bacterium]